MLKIQIMTLDQLTTLLYTPLGVLILCSSWIVFWKELIDN